MNRIILIFIFMSANITSTLAQDIDKSDIFKMTLAKETVSINIDSIFEKDSNIQLFNITGPVYGMSLDMDVEILSGDYLVRIVMEDENGKVFLMSESYPRIMADRAYQCINYAEETSILWKIIPKMLRIHVFGAKVHIKKLNYAKSIDEIIQGGKNIDLLSLRIKEEQIKQKCEKIMRSIEDNNELWYAGVTKLALLPFSERIRILGCSETSMTDGIEFYIGGIYRMRSHNSLSDNQENSLIHSNRTNSPYTNTFSWRCKHGRDWLTSIKDQGQSGYCSAFSAISCVESLVNLYFNQEIDLDLSEQEAAACNGVSNPWIGMTRIAPINYIKNHGVCEETAYPFVDDSIEGRQCRSGEIIPNENVRINGFKNITLSEDSLKKAIMKYGPLSSGYKVYDYASSFSKSHAMCLYGFDIISVGDTIAYLENYAPFSYGLNPPIIVNEGNELVDRTVWKFKNSYINGDESNPQYMNITFDNINSINQAIALLTPVTSLNYDETDIRCEDNDGDGFYNWGIGLKPSNCPQWVPDNPDGDDSNSQLGPVDQYGVFYEANPNDSITLFLEGIIDYEIENVYNRNVVVKSGKTLIVHGTMIFQYGATITVESNGCLIIDGGNIFTGSLILNYGSSFIIENEGMYVSPYNTLFEIPVGVNANISSGTII